MPGTTTSWADNLVEAVVLAVAEQVDCGDPAVLEASLESEGLDAVDSRSIDEAVDVPWLWLVADVDGRVISSSRSTQRSTGRRASRVELNHPSSAIFPTSWAVMLDCGSVGPERSYWTSGATPSASSAAKICSATQALPAALRRRCWVSWKRASRSGWRSSPPCRSTSVSPC